MAALFSPRQANDSATHREYAPHWVRAHRSKEGDRRLESAPIDFGRGARADPAQMVAHGNRALVALAIEIGEQVLVDQQSGPSRQKRPSDFWADMYRYRLALVLAGSTAIGLLVALTVLLSGLLGVLLPPRSAAAPGAMVAPRPAEQLYGYVSASSRGAVSARVRAISAGSDQAGVSISPAVAASAPISPAVASAPVASPLDQNVLSNLPLDQRLVPEAAASPPNASSTPATTSPGASMTDVTGSIPPPQTRVEERTDLTTGNSADINHTKKLSQKARRLSRMKRPTADPEPAPVEAAPPPAETAESTADSVERPDISGRTGSRH
jgi:hypothetical protein